MDMENNEDQLNAQKEIAKNRAELMLGVTSLHGTFSAMDDRNFIVLANETIANLRDFETVIAEECEKRGIDKKKIGL